MPHLAEHSYTELCPHCSSLSLIPATGPELHVMSLSFSSSFPVSSLSWLL